MALTPIRVTNPNLLGAFQQGQQIGQFGKLTPQQELTAKLTGLRIGGEQQRQQFAEEEQVFKGQERERVAEERTVEQERVASERATKSEKEQQITTLRKQAIDGEEGALEKLAVVSPKDATSVQAFQDKSKDQLDEKSKNRLESVATGALEAQNLPDDESRVNFLNKRRAELVEQGISTEDTDEVLLLFANGENDKANALIDAAVKTGRGLGFIKGKPEVAGLKERELQVKEGTLEQRKTEQEFKEKQAEVGEEKLSATTQKILDTAQNESIGADTRSRSLNVLANDISKLDVGGGLAATVSENLKSVLGSQDEVSELRRRFNAVRASQAVQNLPPGPASDKDIQLALSGFPAENATGSQLVSFLRGASKLENINAAFQTFKSDLISNQGNTKGMIQKWKQKVPSSELGRDIQMSELFITAQNRGIAIDDLKKQLGIE